MLGSKRTKILYLTRESNSIRFSYCEDNFSVTSSDCVKGPGVVRKLHLFCFACACV